MILYQLVIYPLIKFLGIDELFKEEETLLMRLRRKKQPVKLRLLFDPVCHWYVTIVLFILTVVLLVSIPLHAVDEPCVGFHEEDYPVMEATCNWLNDHKTLVDATLITTFVVLVYFTYDLISDAINLTDINISPWVLQGKYTIEVHDRKTCDRCKEMEENPFAPMWKFDKDTTSYKYYTDFETALKDLNKRIAKEREIEIERRRAHLLETYGFATIRD